MFANVIDLSYRARFMLRCKLAVTLIRGRTDAEASFYLTSLILKREFLLLNTFRGMIRPQLSSSFSIFEVP